MSSSPPSQPRWRPRRTSRWFVAAVAAVSLAIVAALALALRPGVPRTLVLATGFKNGSYHRFALDYRAILARHGVKLELRPTRGAPENLKLLEDPASGVAVGFVQGGALNGGRTTSEGLRESIAVEHPDLVALGSLFHEPLWIFHRLPGEPTLLSELAGKRVAIGGTGTGTQVLVRELLPLDGLAPGAFDAREIGGSEAVAALATGQVDAVMVLTAETSPILRQLGTIPGVRLMSLAHAEAIGRRLPWLAPLTLPRGGLDLALDLPSRDVQLVSSTAALVARRELHPALVLLLLEAATETHSEPGTFQRMREFPSVEHLELPIDEGARKYIVEGPSLLQRQLPFAIVTIFRRLSFILPAAALLLSILKYAPRVYAWWVSQRIYRWYGQLRTIEDELDRADSGVDVGDWLARVDALEQAVAHLSTPLGYSDRVYTLREHVQFVRNELHRRRDAGGRPAARSTDG